MPSPDPKPVPVSRAVGRFLGHLWQAVRADPKTGRVPAHRTEVRRDVDEREVAGPNGERVIVRRTTIEEIEVERGDASRSV